MMLDIQVELRDAPGQLGSVLATVSRFGGNIHGVQHERARARGEWVPVRLQLEAAEDAAERLVDALRSEFRVLSVSGQIATVPYAFLLLGHVFQAQVSEITDAVFAAGAEVRGVRAEITRQDEPSAVLVEIVAPDAAVVEAARERVMGLAKAKGLVYVDALDGGGAL